MRGIPFLVCFLFVSLAGISSASDYRCYDNRVKKSGGTVVEIHESGGDFVIRKSGSTLARVVRSSGRWRLRISGSTKASYDETRIYRSGGTWTTVRDTQRVFACSPNWSAALWVLQQMGRF